MDKISAWRSLVFVVGLIGSQSVYAASCDYRILNEWNTGFTAQVTISNELAETLNDWSVTLSYSDGTVVSNSWNTILSGQNPYVAENLSYNGTIFANSSTSFGFNGVKAVRGSEAQVPELGGLCAQQQAPINQAPVADISADKVRGSTPLEVRFDANGSSDVENDTLSFLWDFGNGDTSTERVVTRTFDQVGSYSVSLTVNDGQLDSNLAFTTVVAADPATETDGDLSSYTLDSANSSLYFVSTRRTHDLETQTFTDISGSISQSGEARLSINLSSIASGVEIRNQRMRDLLFEVDTFSDAIVTLPVNLEALAAQGVGSTVTENISAILDLHGVSAALDTELKITKLSDTGIMVQNVSPILISAGDYDLIGGLEALRELANLPSISYTVPVNFTLLFNTSSSQ